MQPRSKLADRARYAQAIVSEESEIEDSAPESPPSKLPAASTLQAQPHPSTDQLRNTSFHSATVAMAAANTVELTTIRNPNGYPPYVTGIGLRGVVVQQKTMSVGDAHKIESELIRTYQSRATRDVPEY